VPLRKKKKKKKQRRRKKEEEEETWSATLKEKHGLTVSENRVLKKIFRPKTEEVKEEWRRLCNVKRLDLYSSPDVIQTIKSRRMRLAGHVARMGKDMVETIWKV
jgi:hypothetical protein